MIPQRVRIAGFLSYKEEQEIRFEGAPVWMLTGTNGSGKSAVFDALTYALFGYHRGGSQNANELINKESSAMSVEFDFLQDHTRYRIRRTLRRSKRGTIAGTQQIFHQPGGSAASDNWEPVPDTGKKVDFDRWIHDRIGLDYEIFTSSVLLLQGKAEKLLDSKPSGRAEVLAGIVDLERYQRLHEKANTKKLERKSRLEALSHQTAAVPEVTDAEYATTELRIVAAEDARHEAQVQIHTITEWETQARSWAEVQHRLDAARIRLKQSEYLLGEAVAIETAYARLQELRSVLPAAHTIVTVRGQLLESEKKTEQLEKERLAATERKQRAERDLERAHQQRTRQRDQQTRDETRFQTLNARLRELTKILETARLAEEQQAEQDRLRAERQHLPDDPTAALRAAEREVERLTELCRVLPILERFSTERHDLSVARKTLAETEQKQRATRKAGEQRKSELTQREAELAHATQTRTAADSQVAIARTLADQAAQAVAEFATMAGAKSCRACGQPLTAAHFAEEKRLRETELHAANERHRQAVRARETAILAENALADQVTAIKQEQDARREEYRALSVESKHAGLEVKRLVDSLSLRYAEMPEPYRSRIAPAAPNDWTTTTYPERDELAGLRRETVLLPDAKRKLNEARDVRERCEKLNARIDTIQHHLTGLRAHLPADLTGLREEHRTLHAEEATLTSAIQGAKKAALQLETEIDKLGRESHAAIQLLGDLSGKLQTEEALRKQSRAEMERTRKNLPEAWQKPVEAARMADYHGWSLEHDALISANTEEKYKQLAIARGGLAGQRQEIEELTATANAFPEAARRRPDVIKAELAAARAAFEERDQEWQDARRHRDLLDSYRQQRDHLHAEFLKIDGEHTRYKLLSELLGRDRLQRHLVRQAERQIVDYANTVLDRLSSGQLFLKVVGADDGSTADKALDLECANRITGGAPINVAFLSGSQRFRVAVSLALAIGQYASRQHRPIESVIIDEGFGCLDRQGRQVMIQELQNLRGHLSCILLVSHQEEFADAFPDGYRFALENGATRVTRV
ncbi:MAG: SMC family ATPase [Bacteroidales bacterium]|nr:SMC family ATPase [Bacteroidales bacterium]